MKGLIYVAVVVVAKLPPRRSRQWITPLVCCVLSGGDWLDTDDEGPPSVEDKVSDAEQTRIADLQWVDALLSNLNGDRPEAKLARDQRCHGGGKTSAQ